MDWYDAVNMKQDENIVQGKIVGMSFIDTYPGNLYQLFSDTNAALPATLIRNPDNEYDKNACEVHSDGVFVGHLARDVAVEVAPRLDADEEYTMLITLLVVPGHETNPGLAYKIHFEKRELSDSEQAAEDLTWD